MLKGGKVVLLYISLELIVYGGNKNVNRNETRAGNSRKVREIST